MKTILLFAALYFLSCCSYVERTENNGLIISTDTNDVTNEISYSLRNEITSWESEYRIKGRQNDSIIMEFFRNPKAHEYILDSNSRNKMGVKILHSFHHDAFDPINNYHYFISDTSVVDIDTIILRKRRYHVATVKFIIKKDGETEIIGNKKGKIIKADIIVKNGVVLPSDFPNSTTTITHKGICNCK
jgi:hypothetical protein